MKAKAIKLLSLLFLLFLASSVFAATTVTNVQPSGKQIPRGTNYPVSFNIVSTDTNSFAYACTWIWMTVDGNTTIATDTNLGVSNNCDTNAFSTQTTCRNTWAVPVEKGNKEGMIAVACTVSSVFTKYAGSTSTIVRDLSSANATLPGLIMLMILAAVGMAVLNYLPLTDEYKAMIFIVYLGIVVLTFIVVLVAFA